MTTVIFTLLTLPIYLLMLWPLVVASRRVLGVRIRTARALIGAAIGWAAATRVMLSVVPIVDKSTGAFVGLLLPIAGASFLATLIFLFLAETRRESTAPLREHHTDSPQRAARSHQ